MGTLCVPVFCVYLTEGVAVSNKTKGDGNPSPHNTCCVYLFAKLAVNLGHQLYGAIVEPFFDKRVPNLVLLVGGEGGGYGVVYLVKGLGAGLFIADVIDYVQPVGVLEHLAVLAKGKLGKGILTADDQSEEEV